MPEAQFQARGTTNAHIARATIEGITYQVYDLVKSMEADFGGKRVESTARACQQLMMQFQLIYLALM
jgi:glycerol kinase